MADDLAVRVGAAKGEPAEFSLWPGLVPPLMADTVRSVWGDRGAGKLAWVSSSDPDTGAALAEALEVELRPWAD